MTGVQTCALPIFAFLGYGEGGSLGIYIWDAGVIQKLIDSGDSIDARNVLLLDFNREAFSGSKIVFVANFAGAFLQGVYVAPVPEPGAIAMQITALGGLFAAVRFRARSKRRATSSATTPRADLHATGVCVA